MKDRDHLQRLIISMVINALQNQPEGGFSPSEIVALQYSVAFIELGDLDADKVAFVYNQLDNMGLSTWCPDISSFTS